VLHLVAEHCCVTYRRRREHRSCFLQSMKGRQGSPFALGVSGASSSYCPSPAHAGSRGGCWTQAVSCCSQLQLWGPGPASCSDESWEVIVAVEILLKKKKPPKTKKKSAKGHSVHDCDLVASLYQAPGAGFVLLQRWECDEYLLMPTTTVRCIYLKKGVNFFLL